MPSTDYDKWGKIETEIQRDEEKEEKEKEDEDGKPKLEEEGGILSHIPEELDRDLSLIFAAKENQTHVIEELIAAKADVNGKIDPNGRTSLHWGVSHGVEGRKAIELLLKAKARIDMLTKKDETPLICAINADVNNCGSIMEALLEGGVCVEKSKQWVKDHALYYASLICSRQATRYLLSNGSDPWGYDDDGLFCVHHYAYSDVALLNTVLLGCTEKVNLRGPGDLTALHFAVQRDFFPGAHALLELKADVGMEGMNGETPLNCVKSENMLKLLLEMKAEVNFVPRLGRSALIAVLDSDGFPVVNKHHFNRLGQMPIPSQDHDGQAMDDGVKERFKMVNLLIQHLADVNLETKLGKPIVAAARRNRSEDVISLLLANHADVNGCCWHESKITALTVAVVREDFPVCKVLLEYTADPNINDDENEKSMLMRSTNIELTKLLLDSGAKIDTISVGKTALMVAAAGGESEKTELLLKYKADVNFKAKRDRTALTIAAANQHEHVCKLLIRHGADRTHASVDGTAAQLAERCGASAALVEELRAE